MGAWSGCEDEPEDPERYAHNSDEENDSCANHRPRRPWGHHQLEQRQGDDRQHEEVEDDADDVASGECPVLSCKIAILSVGEHAHEPAPNEAELRQDDDNRNEYKEEDGHASPHVSLPRHAYILAESCQSIRAVDNVDAVVQTLRAIAFANKALVEEKNRPTSLADDWLEETRVVQTQASCQNDELYVLQTIPETRGDEA